ncbi:MAG TPA: hypothetical protein VFI29_18270 [Hanamia sp.]|nr:hypothetical protein [Hanamia sp.]
MKTLFIICTCFLSLTGLGQQNGLNGNDNQHIYATNAKILTLNTNSKDFIRILDGLELDKNFSIPKNFKINSVWRLSDTLKLKKLGIENFKEPYMLLSSFASDTRRFIYKKANIRYQFKELNLPIFLNNELITFDKYSLLNNCDTTLITSARYIKPESKFSRNNKMPFGFIRVIAAKETTFK